MVLEVAPLTIRPGQEPAFEAAFSVAQAIIASMPGYRSHELQRCLERTGEYLLLVRWDCLEDHEVGFRRWPLTGSSEAQAAHALPVSRVGASECRLSGLHAPSGLKPIVTGTDPSQKSRFHFRLRSEPP